MPCGLRRLGLAREEQCSGLSCAATPSRSLLQAQAGARRGGGGNGGTGGTGGKGGKGGKGGEIDAPQQQPGPTFWADEAYQVAECDRQGAYDEVMSTDETGRQAASERIHEHYEKLGLGKWQMMPSNFAARKKIAKK